MARGMLKHSNFTKAEQRLILEDYFRYDLRGINGEKLQAIAPVVSQAEEEAQTAEASAEKS